MSEIWDDVSKRLVAIGCFYEAERDGVLVEGLAWLQIVQWVVSSMDSVSVSDS